MTKICFVSNDVNPHAGLGRVVNSMADEFSARGYEVGIVAPKSNNKVFYTNIELSMKIDKKHPIKFIIEFFRLRRFLSNYDIVIAFDPRPVGIFTFFALLGKGKKFILYSLGTYALFETSKLKNFLTELVYKRASKVFVINTFVKRCIEESKANFKFGKNLALVPIGVNTKLFYKNQNPTYKFGSKYILSVGGIKLRKGQLKSVLAFIEIAGNYPDLHYVIVGDVNEKSSYINEIRTVISKSGLGNKIHLINKITDKDLIDLYSGALFFVLTPTTTKDFIEGFGMVYIEAALCGITSIGTWNTGAEAAIEHNKSGILTSENISDISLAMKDLLNDEKKRDLYAEYAKTRAQLFDWTKIVDACEAEILNIN